MEVDSVVMGSRRDKHQVTFCRLSGAAAMPIDAH